MKHLYKQFVLLTLALMLSACAAPAASELSLAATEPTTTQTAAPAPEKVSATEATPLPTPTTDTKQPIKAVPTPLDVTQCSSAGIEQALLVTMWDRQLYTNGIFPVDHQSGLPICGYAPLPYGSNSRAAYSPDGRWLALAFSMLDSGADSVLHLIDLQNWQSHDTGIVLNGWTSAMTFSPSGSQLAVITGSPHSFNWPLKYTLRLIDLESRQVTAEQVLAHTPRLLSYAQDGQQLVLYQTNEEMQQGEISQPWVQLISADNLETLWEAEVTGVLDGSRMEKPEAEGREAPMVIYTPGVAYSATDHLLYIVHADAEKLTTVDLAMQSFATTDIYPATSWIERLLARTADKASAKVIDGTRKDALLSGDGRYLFVTGYWDDTSIDDKGNYAFQHEGLGLQVIDARSGAEVRRLKNSAGEISLLEGGNLIVLRGWDPNSGWTELVDATTFEMVKRLPGHSIFPTRLLDGTSLLLSSRDTGSRSFFTTLHPTSFAEIASWQLFGHAGWVMEP